MAETITYRMEGDYSLPNLSLPEGGQITLGKYALLRSNYLKQNRKTLYLNMLTAGTLYEHLTEIEQTARERMEQLTRQMAERQGVTEQMKAENQMQWVGLMNNIQHSAEETILSDLIYT